MTIEIRRSRQPHDRLTCARQPCSKPAEVVFGARPHCRECADELRAFVDGVRDREGDEAVRKAVVP